MEWRSHGTPRSMELRPRRLVEAKGISRAGLATMHDSSRPNDFERSDANPRLISSLAIGIASFLIAVPFIVFAAYSDAPHLGRIQTNLPQPPSPRLQVQPKAAADRLHAREHTLLNEYDWADRAHEIVRIPVEQAMRLISERGLKGWPSLTTGEQAPR